MEEVINARKIRAFLWQNKLTRAEFCKRCGISVAVLRKIENNQLNFDARALVKIARVMDIDICELLRK